MNVNNTCECNVIISFSIQFFNINGFITNQLNKHSTLKGVKMCNWCLMYNYKFEVMFFGRRDCFEFIGWFLVWLLLLFVLNFSRLEDGVKSNTKEHFQFKRMPIKFFRGRFHKSWSHGANHRDSFVHLCSAPMPYN